MRRWLEVEAIDGSRRRLKLGIVTGHVMTCVERAEVQPSPRFLPHTCPGRPLPRPACANSNAYCYTYDKQPSVNRTPDPNFYSFIKLIELPMESGESIDRLIVLSATTSWEDFFKSCLLLE